MRHRAAKTALVTAALSVPLALAACGSHNSATANHSIPPAARASMSALASVPGADAEAILVKAGVPVNGTSAQQIAFARSMMVKANRHALAQRLGITDQAGFEAALLDAAKKDHVLTSHDGRREFFDVDLPNVYARYAG